MTETPDGKTQPWSYEDARGFEYATCQACGEPLLLGELVVERPALSLAFYHAEEERCRDHAS